MSRSRSRGLQLVGVVAGLAAIAATAALAVSRSGSGRHALPLAPLATLGQLRPPLAAGPLGPEGVPIPAGPPLAPPHPLQRGERIDGISCEATERVAFHVHVHLRVVVRGRSREVPAGIGIGAPYEVALTPSGRFVARASCFMWLHTHAADGVVHIESPVRRSYTLGELFDIWGLPLDGRRAGPARGRVTVLVDGRVFTGSPRQVPLLAHGRIELEVGTPLVAPDTITFPHGL